MSAVPAATPVTMPDDGPTVATEILLLVHVPPNAELNNEIVCPTQTDDGPDIAGGLGFTVKVLVRTQPVPRV